MKLGHDWHTWKDGGITYFCQQTYLDKVQLEGGLNLRVHDCFPSIPLGIFERVMQTRLVHCFEAVHKGYQLLPLSVRHAGEWFTIERVGDRDGLCGVFPMPSNCKE
jgi:hypothetical protein